MDSSQLSDCIINPVLRILELDAPPAPQLILGTAAVESQMGRYIKQINGPALSLYQIEPATRDDLFTHFLPAHPKLLATVNWLKIPHFPNQLPGNLYYATAICRLIYYRVPEALPEPGDIEGLAKYWKKYYNTHLGKGTEAKFMEAYKRYVG